jgi:hypothetical protein
MIMKTEVKYHAHGLNLLKNVDEEIWLEGLERCGN